MAFSIVEPFPSLFTQSECHVQNVKARVLLLFQLVPVRKSVALQYTIHMFYQLIQRAISVRFQEVHHLLLNRRL